MMPLPTRIVVLCRDVPASGPLRVAAMAQHFAHIEAMLAEIDVAGPLYDAGGSRMIGSLFCLRTASAERARQLVEGDPYFKAGVWQSIEYLPFLPAAGEYVGGKTW